MTPPQPAKGWTHHDEIQWLRTVLAESDMILINRHRELIGLPQWSRLDMLRSYMAQLRTRRVDPGFHKAPVLDEISALVAQELLRERGTVR